MRTIKSNSTLGIAIIILAACTSVEETARRVKEPLNAAVIDRSSVEAAYQEARTRLTAVGDDEVRSQLAADIEALHSAKVAAIESMELAARRNAQRVAILNAIRNIDVRTRLSMLDDGSKVLVLGNAEAYDVSFDLRCAKGSSGASTTLYVTVPARARAEVGFLEGLPDLRAGDKCEARVSDEVLWSRTIS